MGWCVLNFCAVIIKLIFMMCKDLREMIDKGELKLSSLEKALVKVGSYDTGEITRAQFNQLTDLILKAVNDVNINYEFEEEDESSDDEMSEEALAREVYEELKGKKAQLKLIDFLKWEDVQELLDSGALSKDDLATVIDSCAISVEKDDISFDQFYALVVAMEDFIDHDKIPKDPPSSSSSSSSSHIEERRILVDDKAHVGDLMEQVDTFLDGEGDTSVAYVNSKGVRTEGEDALDELEDDFEDDLAAEEEVLEMVCRRFSIFVYLLLIICAVCRAGERERVYSRKRSPQMG